MITAAQLRAARAMIGLSIEELAEAASVSGNSIRDAEASTGNAEPELSRKLKHALESRGIIFVATGQQDASPVSGCINSVRTKVSGLRI